MGASLKAWGESWGASWGGSWGAGTVVRGGGSSGKRKRPPYWWERQPKPDDRIEALPETVVEMTRVPFQATPELPNLKTEIRRRILTMLALIDD